MLRRSLCLSAAASLLGAAPDLAAQTSSKVARVGWVAIPSTWETGRFDAFRAGLRDRGWIEGRNLLIERRWGARGEGLELAAGLKQAKVDVIVSTGAIAFDIAKAAEEVPIVFLIAGDPVEGGLVASMARPQRNCTGLTMLAYELIGKRLEFLSQAKPNLSRIAFAFLGPHPGAKAEEHAARSAAQQLGLSLQLLPLDTEADIDAALRASEREGAQALLTSVDGAISRNARRIADHAIKRSVPVMSGWGEHAADGYLMTYGPSVKDTFQYLAGHVDKILRGAKAAEIPVELPPKIELVLNLKTAKALGLTLPATLLARADELIR